MAHIILANGPERGTRHELGSQTILGRYPFCDVVLPDKNISRQHARISFAAERYYVEDLNSLNGTFVNGQRVRERTLLFDQDRVQVYDYTWHFHDSQSPQREPSSEVPASPVSTSSGSDRSDAKIVTAVDPQVDAQVREKLNAVLQMTRSLGTSLNDENQLIGNILGGVLALFPKADRGSVLFAEGDSEWSVRAFQQSEEMTNTDELPAAVRGLASRVLRTGEALLGTDDQLDGDDDSVFAPPLRSFLCAPLLRPNREPLGVIYLEASAAERSFDEEDLEILLSVATIGGQALVFARNHQASLILDRQQVELAMAHQVQMHFLPRHRPQLEGYQFFQYYESASQVGGDYFGYLPLSDKRLAIAVGDVSGKGISAALMMARLSAEVRYWLAVSNSASEALEHLSREMLELSADQHFITFALAMLDSGQHTLALANAGHLTPLRKRAADGRIEQLGAAECGFPLGVSPVRPYQSLSVPLEPGDSVVMFTDGITEAMDSKDRCYGLPRLIDLLERAKGDCTHLGRSIVADVRGYAQSREQSDDICIVCLQRNDE